jgi:NAD(P)-dependent dehydrogenase (short-subunit alcohol dehydrogenase family)
MGNGKAVSILFAREGARVLVVDQLVDRARETVRSIKGEGGEASVLVADVTKAADCEAMVSEVMRRYGRLDILHNNVGINGPGSVVEVSLEEWDRVMRINLDSMMLTSKYAIPRMAAGGGGSIVNISSISAIRPRGMTPYTVSKAGVVALTQAMAIDHAKDNIRVNCILPGPAYTSMVAEGMSPALREMRRQASPLKIEGNSWDVAWAAVYLASDEARWVTGVALTVDGGVSLDSPRR